MNRVTLWDGVDIFDYDSRYPVSIADANELAVGDKVCFLKSRFLPVYPSTYVVDDLIEAEILKVGKMVKMLHVAQNGVTTPPEHEFSVKARNLIKIWAKREARENEATTKHLLDRGRLPWRLEVKPRKDTSQPEDG